MPFSFALVFSHLSSSVTFAGFGRAHQHLREQLVRIERDRSEQLIERAGRNCAARLRRLVPRRPARHEQHDCCGNQRFGHGPSLHEHTPCRSRGRMRPAKSPIYPRHFVGASQRPEGRYYRILIDVHAGRIGGSRASRRRRRVGAAGTRHAANQGDAGGRRAGADACPASRAARQRQPAQRGAAADCHGCRWHRRSHAAAGLIHRRIRSSGRVRWPRVPVDASGRDRRRP